ncbi:MAG: hypothetical protein J5793_03920, partial [Clostridia bacterium]|nr:hypothetical protein [Clostridia bacterium]
MSKIIDFNAREFRFDPGSKKFGGRMFVTKNGKPHEVFTLETYNPGAGQTYDNYMYRTDAWITAKKTLEPHTDYLFRIEVTCDKERNVFADLRCSIFDVLDWDDKTIYPIGESAFEPAISKLLPDGRLLRVFELPYNTRDGKEFQINVYARGWRVTFDTPAEAEIYAGLADISYDEWSGAENALFSKAEEIAQSNGGKVTTSLLQRKLGIGYSEAKTLIEELERRGVIAASQETKKEGDLGDMISEMVRKATQKANEALTNVDFSKVSVASVHTHDEDDGEDEDEDHADEDESCESTVLDERAFANMLSKIEDGESSEINETVVFASEDGDFGDPGGMNDGYSVSVSDTVLSTPAFRMLLCKIGDGCNFCFADCADSQTGDWIGRVFADEHNRFDGCDIVFEDCSISAATAALIAKRLGDGNNIAFNDCSVTPYGLDEIDPAVDLATGNNISFNDCVIPEKVFNMF